MVWTCGVKSSESGLIQEGVFGGLVRGLVGRFEPGGEAGPRFIGKNLYGGKRTLGLVFAKLRVEEGIIEAGALPSLIKSTSRAIQFSSFIRLTQSLNVS